MLIALRELHSKYSTEKNYVVGFEMLDIYRKFVDEFPNLSGANSEGLRETVKYVSQICDSSNFNLLCGFLDEVRNMGSIDLTVTSPP